MGGESTRRTVSDAAREIGVTPGRIRQFIAEGRLRAKNLAPSGHKPYYVIAEEELMRFRMQPRKPGRPHSGMRVRPGQLR